MRALLLALPLLLAACAPTIPNRAAAFQPLTGTVVVRLTIAVEPGSRAEFMLDGEPIGTDADASDGYALPIDTARFKDGTHLLRSRIYKASGVLVEDVTHTLLFLNGTAAAR